MARQNSKNKLCLSKFLFIREFGLWDITERHRRNGISWTRLREIENQAVLLVRPYFLDDIKKHLGLEGTAWVYFMWPGYPEAIALS